MRGEGQIGGNHFTQPGQDNLNPSRLARRKSSSLSTIGATQLARPDAASIRWNIPGGECGAPLKPDSMQMYRVYTEIASPRAYLAILLRLLSPRVHPLSCDASQPYCLEGILDRAMKQTRLNMKAA